MSVGRFIRTLRHLRSEQLKWRVRYRLERAVGLRRVPAVPKPVPRWEPHALVRLRDLAARWGAIDARARERVEAFRVGRFDFLHDPADFSQGIDWASGGRARLWRYQLHYFDCAKELALAPAEGDAAMVRGWMRDWIAKNPPGTDVAWDAFTVSARLLNWALAAAVFGIDDEDIRASYHQQASWLATHLEHDVGANHLLKNACALCVAGILVAPALLQAGTDLLGRELQAQLLPDGAHYERAPMYHALVLEDLLIVCVVLGVPIRHVAAHACDFLAGILHPDGELPFFGDTVLGEARAPRLLLEVAGHHAEDAPSHAFPDAGFYVLRDAPQRLHLIAKAGAPGPAWQLGHAHADALSYELSLDGQRVIVNSGVHGYADSPHRTACRAEAAHNTAAVIGTPQLETWAAFRVGRRYALLEAPAWPETWTGKAYASIQLPSPKTKVTRQWTFLDVGFRVETTTTPARPLIDRIHLTPGLRWEVRDAAIHALRNDATLLVVSTDAAISIEAGSHWPEFGKTEATEVLTLRSGTGKVSYTLQLPR